MFEAAAASLGLKEIEVVELTNNRWLYSCPREQRVEAIHSDERVFQTA